MELPQCVPQELPPCPPGPPPNPDAGTIHVYRSEEPAKPAAVQPQPCLWSENCLPRRFDGSLLAGNFQEKREVIELTRLRPLNDTKMTRRSTLISDDRSSTPIPLPKLSTPPTTLPVCQTVVQTVVHPRQLTGTFCPEMYTVNNSVKCQRDCFDTKPTYNRTNGYFSESDQSQNSADSYAKGPSYKPPVFRNSPAASEVRRSSHGGHQGIEASSSNVFPNEWTDSGGLVFQKL